MLCMCFTHVKSEMIANRFVTFTMSHWQRYHKKNILGAFLWENLKTYHWSKITWITVHQRNRRIVSQSGFICSFDLWSMIRVPKETHPLHLIILFQVETTLYKFLRVWTKRGVGHGLPHGLAYGLSVVNFLKTRLSIAASLCKQRALSMCHICDSQSILLAAFRANFLSRLVVDKNQGHQNGV